MAPAANIKGLSLCHLLEYLRTTFGEEGLAKIRQAVSPEAQQSMLMPSNLGWYPLAHLAEIERKACDLFYGGDYTQAARFGLYDMERSINSIFKIMLRLMQPTFLIQKSAKMWSTMVDQGRLEFDDQSASRHITVYLRDIDPVFETYCHDIRGTIQGALVACGIKPQKALHSECVLKGAEACRFDFSW